MNDRIAAEVFSPGEFLAEELEARGWTQVDLGEILGRPPRLVNEIIAGKRAITPETAKGLAAALGTSAEYWMNLETAYRLSKAHVEDQPVTQRAKLYGLFPVKEMLKRGWVEASESIEVLEQRFLEYFGMDSIDDQPRFAHAARKTIYEGPSNVQLAWLNRAKEVAKAVQAQKFTENLLRDAIVDLRACLEYVEEIRNVTAILSRAGVRLVVVEALASMKMDGACFWIDDSPVIALTMRYDRVDNFWHNLFHEIDHIMHGEGREIPIVEEIDAGTSEKKLPENERRANAAASSYCIDRQELNNFIDRLHPIYSKEAIVGFSSRIKVHPGIVVGQLHGRQVIPFSFHRAFLVKVRAAVTSSVLTDGFGNKLPL